MLMRTESQVKVRQQGTVVIPETVLFYDRTIDRLLLHRHLLLSPQRQGRQQQPRRLTIIICSSILRRSCLITITTSLIIIIVRYRWIYRRFSYSRSTGGGGKSAL